MTPPPSVAERNRRPAATRDDVTPLVSVVTIFFNAARFLEEAIRSVFAQSYARWELILVDDGSSDGSSGIARRWAAGHPGRVRYVEHPDHVNRGMSASRNAGVAHAHGEYIAFLDADDVYLPEKLERQVAILRARPEVDVVYGASMYWYGWTGREEDHRRDLVRWRGIEPGTLVHPPLLVERFLRGQAQTPATCGVLLRREAVERVGGFEESFRGIFEDQAFFFKIALTARVFAEEGCWDRYRQHPDSMCQVLRARREWHPVAPSPAKQAFLAWLGDYLRGQRVTDPKVWRAYDRKMFPYRHPRAYAALTFARRASNPRRVWGRVARELSTRLGTCRAQRRS